MIAGQLIGCRVSSPEVRGEGQASSMIGKISARDLVANDDAASFHKDRVAF
jgi:hypothetical protein